MPAAIEVMRFDIDPAAAARTEDARAAITRFDAELSAKFDGEFAPLDNALRQLQEAGALSRPGTVHGEGQKRNVVWQANAVLEALDRFGERARRDPRSG